MRESMVFYRSFYESVEDLPPEEFKSAVMAILGYGLDGKCEEVSGVSKSILALVKPQIDKNNKRYENSLKGGRKSTGNQTETKHEPNANQVETKPKPNRNQTETKSKPNDNVNVNDNVNEKDNKKHLCTAEAAALFERLWKLYPVKKGKGQVSDTQKKKLLAIGEPALLKAIERYRAELAKDSGWRRPQNGSTFFNSGYVDYLDANFAPDKPAPRKASSGAQNKFCNFEQRNYNYDELIYADIKGGAG